MGPARRAVGALSGDGELLTILSSKGAIGLDTRTGKARWGKTAKELGLSRDCLVSVGEGMGVLVEMQVGNCVAIDLADGKELWNADPADRFPHVQAAPEIAFGTVIVRHSGNRGITCVHSRTGRKLKTFSGNLLQGIVTDDGFFIVMNNGALSVYVAGQFEAPLWEANRYDRRKWPAILAARHGLMLVSPQHNSGTVEVLSMLSGGQKIAELSLPQGRYPADAILDTTEGRAYVISSSQQNTGRKRYYGRWTMTRQGQLHRFDINSRRHVWACPLNPARNSYGVPLTPVEGRDRLAVTMPQTIHNTETWHVVIEKDSGKLAARFPAGKMDARRTQGPRMFSLGPPAFVEDRMIVESVNDVKVFAPKN